MLPSRSEISGEAINMKILTKNHPDSPHSHPYFRHSHPDSHIPTPIPRIPSLIPHVTTLIPRVPTVIPRVPIIPFPDSPFRLLQIANFWQYFFLVILYIFNKRITILPKANILRIYRMLLSLFILDLFLQYGYFCNFFMDIL